MSADAVTSRARLREQSPLRQSAETRQQILQAARAYLKTRPFRELTVAALMATTNLSRPAFYQYFADVHELMETLIAELSEEWAVAVVPWFTAEGDPVPGLAHTLRDVIRIAHDWGPLIRAVVDSAPTDARLEEAWDEVVQHYFDAVTDRIEKDQAAGRAPAFDARITSISLCLMNVQTFVHHFGQAKQFDPGEVWSMLTRLWVCTIYGHKAWAEVENYEYE